jgi:hypothetical protein
MPLDASIELLLAPFFCYPFATPPGNALVNRGSPLHPAEQPNQPTSLATSPKTAPRLMFW